MPLTDTDSQNVFWSLTFEMNYNMPYCPRESFPGPLIRIPGAQGDNTTITSDVQNPAYYRPTCEQWSLPEDVNGRRARSLKDDKTLLTRTGIYHLIEHRLAS